MKTALKTALLTVAGLVFAACGNPAAQHVGLYNYSGRFTVDTPSANSHHVESVDGTVDIFEGMSSDLVIVMYDDCLVRLTTNDFNKASIDVDTECHRDFPNESIDETFTTGTVVFNGAIATVTLESDFVDVYEGRTYVGTAKYDLTLTKLTK